MKKFFVLLVSVGLFACGVQKEALKRVRVKSEEAPAEITAEIPKSWKMESMGFESPDNSFYGSFMGPFKLITTANPRDLIDDTERKDSIIETTIITFDYRETGFEGCASEVETLSQDYQGYTLLKFNGRNLHRTMFINKYKQGKKTWGEVFCTYVLELEDENLVYMNFNAPTGREGMLDTIAGSVQLVN